MKDYSFGNFICELRQRNGLSQFQLGTLVGVSNKAVSKWENGSAKPKIATCHKLALVLGVSLDELLTCKYHVPVSTDKGVFAMKKELWKKVERRLYELYGEHPHVSVLGRFETEKSLMSQGELIVHFDFLSKLAEKTKMDYADMFIFGNVNSSFIAWLMGITPVNPLEPHYFCPECKKIEFQTDVADGWDLPEKKCSCGCRMQRDGHSIPCEAAIGSMNRNTHFDVTLSETERSTAETLLKNHFKAAVEFVEVRFERKNALLAPKRFVFLPKADDKKTLNSIMEIDYEEFRRKYAHYPYYTFLFSTHQETLQRLCIKTNRSPEGIDYRDQKVVQLYKNGEIAEFLECKGRPIREAMRNFAPESFSEILQVYGFHHATDAWEGNGKDYVDNGIAKRNEVIAFSENVYGNILKRLQAANITGNGLAVKVMENVRLGHFHKYGMPEAIENTLIQLGFPIWYIESMKKIRYLFPKGHAIAYLKTDMRLTWFSITYPDAFKSVEIAIKRDYKEYYD